MLKIPVFAFQFMVQNKLSKEEVLSRASELSFPNSVVEYLQVRSIEIKGSTMVLYVESHYVVV